LSEGSSDGISRTEFDRVGSAMAYSGGRTSPSSANWLCWKTACREIMAMDRVQKLLLRW